MESPVENGSGTKKVMLLTGQSNQWHNWKVSHVALKGILESDEGFAVDVVTTPQAGESFEDFAPDFAKYDTIVLDYEGDEWPGPVKEGFTRFVAEGGGLVIYHATDNAFPDWVEFNEMIGVGGWAGRDEKSGPMVRWDEDEGMVFDHGPGEAKHPAPYSFEVTTRTPEHPVMQGMPETWIHATDELYSQLRGPARNLTVLATARAEKEREHGTGVNEPVLMAIEYGKGRVFHTTLGHVHFDQETIPDSMKCPWFSETLLRGTRWTARLR